MLAAIAPILEAAYAVSTTNDRAVAQTNISQQIDALSLFTTFNPLPSTFKLTRTI